MVFAVVKWILLRLTALWLVGARDGGHWFFFPFNDAGLNSTCAAPTVTNLRIVFRAGRAVHAQKVETRGADAWQKIDGKILSHLADSRVLKRELRVSLG
jgi:hypothetical protein